jgi:hypothetical protein
VNEVRIGQAVTVTRLRTLSIPAVFFSVLVSVATACGGQEPASGVGVPGGDPARPTTTVALSTTTAPATVAPATVAPATVAPATTLSATATTLPATTTAPTTVVATPASTIAATGPTSTVPGSTTTTTEFLYAPEATTGTLRAGMEGPRTLQLQRDLITLGFLPAGADDSRYGPGTAGGVRRFQESKSLVIDGVAGPLTQAALAEAIAAAQADA